MSRGEERSTRNSGKPLLENVNSLSCKLRGNSVLSDLNCNTLKNQASSYKHIFGQDSGSMIVIQQSLITLNEI